MILKPTSLEITVTADDDVSGAKLVRVYAPTANTLVTISSANTAVSSFTMSQDSVEIVEKSPLDTISATNAILCTPVSYKG
jgi:hypothetical protein